MLATIGIVATGTGFRPAGILVSQYCQSTNGTDATGTYVLGAWISVGVYTDGIGGFYESNFGENTNGCYYPSGYYYSYNSSQDVIFWQSYHFGDNGYFPHYFNANWTQADGNGGSTSSGTAYSLAYEGQIIFEKVDVAEGLKYIVAFTRQNGSPTYYEYTVPASGALVSSQCVSQYNPNTGYYTGNWYYQETYSDGAGGTYSTIIGENMNGCWHPQGYIYSESTDQLSLSWTHGTNQGNYNYGYSYSYSRANGSGGVESGSSTTYTASDGAIVDLYTATDPTTGWDTIYKLYYASGNLYNTSYPVAGINIGQSCTNIDVNDAKGIPWSIPSYRVYYSDGYGGAYWYDTTNTQTCGYLPSGYWTSYSQTPLNLYYQDSGANTQSFNYGYEAGGTQATGMGYDVGSADGVTIYYSVGYVFYAYYDEAGQQTVNYCFDGNNSYYTSYS